MSETIVTEFVAVRHGETADNQLKILQGQRDTALSDAGARQAECVAAALAGERFSQIVTSDLRRARQTAEVLAARFGGSPPTLEPDLREWHLGELEGRPAAELRSRYPAVMDAFNVESGDVPVPGGESWFEFNRRVSGCLDALAAAHAGEKLLLVTHSGVLLAIFRHIVGALSPEVFMPARNNAGIFRFRKRGTRWQLCAWNETFHLRPELRRERQTL